jgi:uncharacterized cofD-like protein
MKQKPSVVVLGGGTGTYMMLRAIKRLPIELTAILTMVDDGGSNRVLRDEFGLLPTSGISQCIVALSENPSLLRELFDYRYSKGNGLSGMRFGNLFIAALTDILGSQKEAIEKTTDLLQVRGKILPISYDNVRLVASYEDGTEVVGEHAIDEPQHDGKLHIVGLRTEPKTHITEEARDAILGADLILLGPGDFYTNTAANFVVEGLNEALKQSPGKKIFVTNLMTKLGDSYGYTLTTFLDELDKYYGLDGLDYAVINNNLDYPEKALELYRQQEAEPVRDDVAGDEYHGVKILREDLFGGTIHQKQASDVLSRSILRHDPKKFATFFEKKWLL